MFAFFFFKQKTAYDMRISDWSSDVCSSDLIGRQIWDPELLALLRIPESLLPEVKDSDADFGSTEAALLGRALPIGGIAGDQQAATVGQACFEPGMLKSTYGTGCFALLHTASELVHPQHRLFQPIDYRPAAQTPTPPDRDR